MTSLSLADGLRAVGARRWPWKIPGVDTEGQPRSADKIINIASYDPSPIRGLTPPSRDDTTRIPIALAKPNGTYSWCDMTFWDFVRVNRTVRESEQNYFAIMLEQHAQHLVIDLDGDADAWPQLLGREVELEAEMRALFVEFFVTQFHTEPDMSGWHADHACTPTKTSVHVNHIGAAFTKQQDLREFVLRWVKWIVNTHPDSMLVNEAASTNGLNSVDDFVKTSPIDVRVYNKDRNMRCSYSRKPGGHLLIPMKANTDQVDALWSSLVCYSMPADPAHWLSYDEHTECAALETKKAPNRALVSHIAVMSAESFVEPIDVDFDKGTWVEQLPEKSDVIRGAGDDEGSDLQSTFFMQHLPAPTVINVKLIVSSLSREKRLVGSHDMWRNVIWAVKSATSASDEGYGIVEEWTKSGKKGSKRSGVLQKTWQSGKTNRFNVGSLWRWLKEDVSGDEYKALWRRVHPPEVMETAKRAASAQTGRSIDALKQAFRSKFTDDEKMREADELDFKEVITWWNMHVVAKADKLEKNEIDALGECVLEYCNLFWCFVKLQDAYVLYKKALRIPCDDRAFVWQLTKSSSFKTDLHCNFVLHGWGPNVASRWVAWKDRRTTNSFACISPHARPVVLQKLVPTCFNTWVGLRISHKRALTSAPRGAPNPEWDKFKRYIFDGFLLLETSVAVKQYFLRWYVSQYVRPGYKLKVACAMQSEDRQIGKSFLAQFLQTQLIGDDLVEEVTDQETALGKFNDPLIGKVLVNLEEYQRCKAHNGKLKAYLTSDRMTCHPKGLKAYAGVNCINFYLPTNDDDAFDMKEFKKRIFAVKIGLGYLTPGFEDLIDYEWDAVAIARGMLDWWNDPANGCVKLATKLVDGHAIEEQLVVAWRPEDIPTTLGAVRQKIAAEAKHDPVVAWIRALVEKQSAVPLAWGKWNTNENVHAAFLQHYAGDWDIKNNWSQHKLTVALKTLFPRWARKLRKQPNCDAFAQSVLVPELSIARSEFYRSQDEMEPAEEAAADDVGDAETDVDSTP